MPRKQKLTKLKIELADSPYLLSKGLMHRKEMSEDQGMLFKFPTVVEASFWGKNTYIPLDIAFIQNGTITGIKKIVPLSTRAIRSDGVCDMALEVNAGFFNDNNIKIGDSIDFLKDDDEKELEVLFKGTDAQNS